MTPVLATPPPLARRALRMAGGWLFCACLAFLGAPGYAAGDDAAPAAPLREAGLPPIHNFNSSDYGATSQNWAITQGKQGVIYIGNVADGVLAFDGARWTSIPVPNRFTVRSLATAPDGRVYVGTVGDFGYLAPDAAGRLHYVSLLDKVPASERDFADVWSIHITPDAVYFGTLARIFRLHAGKLTTIAPEHRFHICFLVDGALYVIEPGRGLTRIVDGKPALVPGGARFADERIYAMLPWHGPGATPGEMLLAVRGKGWFLYDGHTFRPWPTEVDAALNQAAVYGALWLADGNLAVATQRAGLFVLDTQGRLVAHLDRANGLATDTIYALYQDDQHGLWLATGEGVTRVDVASAVSVFDARNGLAGNVQDVIRHAGALYAGTTEGCYRLATRADGTTGFVRQRDVPGKNASFVAVDGQLVVATSAGVFAVGADRHVQRVVDGARHAQRTWSVQPMLRSRRQPDRVFIGFKDGVGTIRWNGQRWIDEGPIATAREQADSLAADAGGDLWLGLANGGVGRLVLPRDWSGPADPRAPRLRVFNGAAGLPEGTITPTTIGGHVRFLTSNGIYEFAAATGRFVPDPEFRGLFPDGPRRIVFARQGGPDALWLYTTRSRDGVKETGRAVRRDGRWHWQPAPLQTLSGIDMAGAWVDPDGTVWLASTKGLYRYAPGAGTPAQPPYATLIRDATARNGEVLATHPAGGRMPELAARNNALHVEFAAPSFTDFAANRYQVRLLGAESAWSPWSPATYRDYTNLDAGRYTFEVRARNVYGQLGAPARFTFRVLPPWYRTWWAWLLWCAAGAALLLLGTRWRAAVLKRRNAQLAELVRERNSALAKANEALRGSNERLAQQSTTDPLTGLRNRRYLYDHLEVDLATARRRHADPHADGALPPDAGIVFLMLDIDHFKLVNDTHGHAAGDGVLHQVAEILRATARTADILTRWGGEEFLVVARFVAPAAGALFAERIRAAVAAHAFAVGDGRSIAVTCSIGFAAYPFYARAGEQPGWEQVVHFADECLYAAKAHGRNAWAGVLPMAAPPAGDVMDALRAALDAASPANAVRVAASWRNGDAPR